MSDGKQDSLEQDREHFEKHMLTQQYLDLRDRWQRTYCHMVRALADTFDEERVLDIVEEVWWDMAYEVGKTWRAKFDLDPSSAMREKALSWHDDAFVARFCCCDVPVLEHDRWELKAVKCYRELFNALGEQEIGMSWCLTDFAAVRGWSSRVVMRQPKHLLRGDNTCHQIRTILEKPTTDSGYSEALSEEAGWRSVRRLRREQRDQGSA